MAEDMEKRTRQYIEVRDALKRLEEKHDAEKAPLLQIQERLAGIIQKFLDDNKLENLRTAYGTCHTTTRYSASLADADAFMKHVISTGQFDLLDRRANTTAVKDYVKQHNQLPPGCNLNGITTVGVRRPTGKAKN